MKATTRVTDKSLLSDLVPGLEAHCRTRNPKFCFGCGLDLHDSIASDGSPVPRSQTRQNGSSGLCASCFRALRISLDRSQKPLTKRQQHLDHLISEIRAGRLDASAFLDSQLGQIIRLYPAGSTAGSPLPLPVWLPVPSLGQPIHPALVSSRIMAEIAKLPAGSGLPRFDDPEAIALIARLREIFPSTLGDWKS